MMGRRVIVADFDSWTGFAVSAEGVSPLRRDGEMRPRLPEMRQRVVKETPYLIRNQAVRLSPEAVAGTVEMRAYHIPRSIQWKRHGVRRIRDTEAHGTSAQWSGQHKKVS